MKNAFVIHPFVMAAFPTLAVYSYNAQVLSLSMVWLPLVIALAFALLMFVSTWLLCRSINKAGLIVFLFLVLLYSTAHVFTLLKWLGIGSPYPGGVLLFLMWALLYPYLLYLIARTSKTLRYPTIILNVVAIVMLLTSSVRIGINEVGRLTDDQDLASSQITLQTDPAATHLLPDIYYIVLERYASASTLTQVYDFDNSDFVSYLESKGFYVASESAANYVRTSESLASSLNMEYIDYMDEELSDLLPLNIKIEDNAVQRSLKSAGYTFIHVGSWWGPTRENEFADININHSAWATEFSEVLLISTMPYGVCAELGVVDDVYTRQWKRTLFEFEKMAEIPEMEEPTFTFAHMMISHPPYTFEADGSYLSPEESRNRSDEENYTSALIATEDMVRELVDQLLSKSEVEPIIILQADEGPFPERYRASMRTFKWEDATDMEIKEKMGILNAYHLPGVDGSALYPSITPVNSFRLVFDLYFGTHLGLLPDVSYAYVDYSHPYQFLDVTDRVHYQ